MFSIDSDCLTELLYLQTINTTTFKIAFITKQHCFIKYLLQKNLAKNRYSFYALCDIQVMLRFCML